MSSSALEEGEPPDLAAYLATELEQSWTDADVVRVRDKLMTAYPSEADEFYALTMHKLEDPKVQMFARMNILFIFDKFCAMSAEREEQRRQAARRNGSAGDHTIEEKDADYERAWSQYRGVYAKMQTELEKIVYLVLEITPGPEPPSRRPNSNATWTKKILEGWARRELFPNTLLASIEARIKQAMDLDWEYAVINYESSFMIRELMPTSDSARDSLAHKYDDEKMDRRMDADRERVRMIDFPLLWDRPFSNITVSDAWFITMEPSEGHVLDVSEYWVTASAPLSEQERLRMHRDNSKKHFAGRMECYDSTLRRRPDPPPLAQDDAPPTPYAAHPGPAPPPGLYASSRQTPRQSAESSPHTYPHQHFRRSRSPPNSYSSRARSRSPGYYEHQPPPPPHYHPNSGYHTPQHSYSRGYPPHQQDAQHGPPFQRHSQPPPHTLAEPPPPYQQSSRHGQYRSFHSDSSQHLQPPRHSYQAPHHNPSRY
ncbi:hypothetical protein HDU86_003902 [Geranomyces michiganensis]|nr:hypothetical protein HDU86_003902 [Geranomyces michiganensis]